MTNHFKNNLFVNDIGCFWYMLFCLKMRTCNIVLQFTPRSFFITQCSSLVSHVWEVALKWYCTGACGTNLKFGICGSLYIGRHHKTISMQSCLRLPPLKLWPVYFLIITRKYLFGKSLIYNGIHVCFRNKRFVIGFSKWQTK